MSKVHVDWSVLREIPPGSRGSPRGYCDSCGLYIWSDGGLKIPGVRGFYCSALCLECSLFGPGKCRWCGDKLESSAAKFCCESHRKQSNETRFGDGTRLLGFLSAKHPKLYQRLVSRGDAFCLTCNDPLDGKRDGARFCDDRCKVRYWRKSENSAESGNNRNMPQQNQ